MISGGFGPRPLGTLPSIYLFNNQPLERERMKQLCVALVAAYLPVAALDADLIDPMAQKPSVKELLNGVKTTYNIGMATTGTY